MEPQKFPILNFWTSELPSGRAAQRGGGRGKGSNSYWRPQLGRLKLGERNPNQDAATAAESICGAATE